MTQEDGPVTLRLSGQLMLGVTRIYSRKAQYLFEDCKETRENITRVSDLSGFPEGHPLKHTRHSDRAWSICQRISKGPTTMPSP